MIIATAAARKWMQFPPIFESSLDSKREKCCKHSFHKHVFIVCSRVALCEQLDVDIRWSGTPIRIRNSVPQLTSQESRQSMRRNLKRQDDWQSIADKLPVMKRSSSYSKYFPAGLSISTKSCKLAGLKNCWLPQPAFVLWGPDVKQQSGDFP